MKNNVKEKIVKAFKEQTPDLSERIVLACSEQEQAPVQEQNENALHYSENEKHIKKKGFAFRQIVAIASCIILFGVGLLVGRNIPSQNYIATTETCVYIDVNPSLEITLDKNNAVISCVAANDDAITILNNMNLKGVELDTALNAIVGSMFVNGYLTADDNSILISVDTKGGEKTSEFLTHITQQVNQVFERSEMECSIIAQGVTADEELKHRAEENGISVGKMHLLDKMVENMDELYQTDIRELSGMSIKDLNLLYLQKPDAEQKPKDELISGTVSVQISEEQALKTALNQIEKTLSDVLEVKVNILPSDSGGNRLVYAINFYLKDQVKYRAEVDCKTGEVIFIGEAEHENHQGGGNANNQVGGNTNHQGGGLDHRTPPNIQGDIKP